MKKSKTRVTVRENRRIAEGVFSMELQYPEDALPEEVRPGQFIGVYLPDRSLLLPRPISICKWDAGSGRMRLVFRIAGQGTRLLTGMGPGVQLDTIGILGNGYDLSKLEKKHVLLMGGGIGAPPLLELAAALSGRIIAGGSGSVTAVLGYRSADLFLTDDFEKYSHVLIATEDGSCGVRGNVVDAVHAESLTADVICACGPMPMLKAVARLAGEMGIPAFVSLEERMACGVGACLGCVTKTVRIDPHSHVHNARICTEGPVFAADEIDWEG